MIAWNETIPTSGSVKLPPEPRAMDAIGRNHSLETALADLVDNSIDAGARQVLIRIVRNERTPRSLYVVDNGRGIKPSQINNAMTVGGSRNYTTGDLGHFGVGLKAASFSQAKNLTVLSRAQGYAPVGRSWHLDAAMKNFQCDVVMDDFVVEELEANWGIEGAVGTVIRWDEVGAFPQVAERAETFTTKTTNLISNHLGLVFHRLIEKKTVEIHFEIYDVESPAAGSRLIVEPVNPFGYLRSGHNEFPLELNGNNDQSELTFRCHIWPGRSNLPQFKLPGVRERQGLYFYRHDRLLQAGGWDGLHAIDPKLQLARVEIDIDNDAGGLFRMNPEKSRVLTGVEFAHLCGNARSADGLSFTEYLSIAEEVFCNANKRNSVRRAMIHPALGLPTHLKETIEEQVPKVRSEKGIDIRWRKFDNEILFEVDREKKTLWLNKRYRSVLLGRRHAGLNDLPLIKTLLYLITENLFQGDRLGARDKDNIELWQELLTTAVRSERQ